MAEVLRIQYFERNPSAFLSAILILVELRSTKKVLHPQGVMQGKIYQNFSF